MEQIEQSYCFIVSILSSGTKMSSKWTLPLFVSVSVTDFLIHTACLCLWLLGPSFLCMSMLLCTFYLCPCFLYVWLLSEWLSFYLPHILSYFSHLSPTSACYSLGGGILEASGTGWRQETEDRKEQIEEVTVLNNPPGITIILVKGSVCLWCLQLYCLGY